MWIANLDAVTIWIIDTQRVLAIQMEAWRQNIIVTARNNNKM